MIDAATIEFPYMPASGLTEAYLQSWDYAHERMASKLDEFSCGRVPVGMLVNGDKGMGKTTLLRQLQDIAQRRHGGLPTLFLEVKGGQSILKILADSLLARLDGPEYDGKDLSELRSAIRHVAELAGYNEITFPVANPTMKRRLTSMGMALQAAKLPFVVFIDDVDDVSDIGMKYLVNFVSLCQRKEYPLMFVVAGTEAVFVPIAKACSEGERLFSGFEVGPQCQEGL